MSTKRMLLIAAAAILATAIIAFGLVLLSGLSSKPYDVAIPDMRATSGQSDELYESSFDSLPLVELSPETVGRVVGTMQRAAVYSRMVKTVTYYDGGENTRYISLYVQDGSYSITISGEREKHIVISGERIYIWYSGDYDYYAADLTEDPVRVADEYERMITWEDIMQLPSSSVSEARFEESKEGKCIYVRYTSGTLGYETECSIDTASGLVLSAKTYDGGELIYSMENEILNLGLVPSSVFLLPDGINALSFSG